MISSVALLRHVWLCVCSPALPFDSDQTEGPAATTYRIPLLSVGFVTARSAASPSMLSQEPFGFGECATPIEGTAAIATSATVQMSFRMKISPLVHSSVLRLGGISCGGDGD